MGCLDLTWPLRFPTSATPNQPIGCHATSPSLSRAIEALPESQTAPREPLVSPLSCWENWGGTSTLD